MRCDCCLRRGVSCKQQVFPASGEVFPASSWSRRRCAGVVVSASVAACARIRQALFPLLYHGLRWDMYVVWCVSFASFADCPCILLLVRCLTCVLPDALRFICCKHASGSILSGCRVAAVLLQHAQHTVLGSGAGCSVVQHCLHVLAGSSSGACRSAVGVATANAACRDAEQL